MKSRIFLSPPHMGAEELLLIQEAFRSNYIAPLGPMVDAFEKEFADKVGISHAVALASGTAAMHLALDLLGIQQHCAKARNQRSGVRGQRSEQEQMSEVTDLRSEQDQSERDEVIASTLTFIGSVTPVTFLGATPVFIDADLSTWNMDPLLLEEELEACSKRGRLPKSVIPTDLYGQCADYGRILPICEKYGVPVVADAEEALGATYQMSVVGGRRSAPNNQRSEVRDQRSASTSQDIWHHAGYGAMAAVFSFNGNKIITTSGGGMLVSEDMDFIEKARNLSQQARDPAPHYEHSRIGYNYRMSNVLAAIGRGQLRVLDERVEKKRWIFDYYRQALGDLPGIEFMPEPAYARSTRWLTVVLITPEAAGTDREAVRLALEAENIEARPVWKPMHMQPVFNPQITQISADQGRRVYPCRVRGGEVAEDLFRRGLCLPSGTAMTEEDMDRIVTVIKKCWKK